MITYKLVYSSKEEAVSDLDSKRNDSIEAIVFIGKIVDIEPLISEDGEVIRPATFKEGYCVDVMSSKEINFNNIVVPGKPVHKFFGQE